MKNLVGSFSFSKRLVDNHMKSTYIEYFLLINTSIIGSTIYIILIITFVIKVL